MSRLSLVNIFERIRTPQVFLKLKNFELPEKYKGGRIEKWLEFWKALGQDYKETLYNDVIKESRERPLKAAIILSGIGILSYSIATNPDELSFRDRLTVCTHRISLVSEVLRNPESDSHIRRVNKAYAEGIVQRLNCGLFSIIWLNNYNPDCCLYEAQCTYLKPQYKTFHHRIIDIGFLGRWHNLDRKMVDYDVNPDEWNEKQNLS